MDRFQQGQAGGDDYSGSAQANQVGQFRRLNLSAVSSKSFWMVKTESYKENLL
jgi:hypothetical protein